MKRLKQYLKESETYGIWGSEPVDRTEMGESCGKIKESSTFSKSKIIPLDKVKSFMNKARDKYDVDSQMIGNELVHAFYKKGTNKNVGTFINSNRTYFYDDADKIMESTIKEAFLVQNTRTGDFIDSRADDEWTMIRSFAKKFNSKEEAQKFIDKNMIKGDEPYMKIIKEATMSDIPHEIDDQIHKLKDMRFDLEETQKNWELAGLDTTPLSNVINGINELIHSMYNNGAKLADQEVVNEAVEDEMIKAFHEYEDASKNYFKNPNPSTLNKMDSARDKYMKLKTK